MVPFLKKNEQNKIFLVQEEIIMTPDEMAKRYFAFIVIWKQKPSCHKFAGTNWT